MDSFPIHIKTNSVQVTKQEQGTVPKWFVVHAQKKWEPTHPLADWLNDDGIRLKEDKLSISDTFILAGGHKWRRYAFQVSNAPHGWTTVNVALPEKHGLKQRLAARDARTLPTLEEWKTLAPYDYCEFLIQRHVPVEELTTVVTETEETMLERYTVAWVAPHGVPTLRYDDFGHLRIESAVAYCAVQRGVPGETVVCADSTGHFSFPSHHWDRISNDVFVDAEGKTLFTMADRTREWTPFQPYKDWKNSCGTRYVATKGTVRTTVVMRGRTVIKTTRTPQHPRKLPWAGLRETIDSRNEAEGDFKFLREEKRVLKEALAMAVFRPDRVERMMETYGEDWMERV